MTDHATTITTAIDAFNRGDVDGYIATLYTPDATFHGFPASIPPTLDGITGFFRALRAGLPDATITARDVLVDGDRAAVRFGLTGTHTGDLLGAPGTGRSVDVEGITVLRFVGGRVAERWNRLDDLTFLSRIGAMPAGATA